MTRGVRGATTVAQNEATLILENTRTLVEEMIKKNSITPENVSHVFISVTNDINAGFPARSVREIPGWSLVPVMCMKEIEVPNSLEKCIRIMMVIRTDKDQDEINHIFLNDAIQLRPDLIN
ncbi:MAG TPA: chorismate mutase [Candidatus Dormibacteraeota bacterium]|nr:chorismate mutase [Candidatus Dormibacteraeota bacterium]